MGLRALQERDAPYRCWRSTDYYLAWGQQDGPCRCWRRRDYCQGVDRPDAAHSESRVRHPQPTQQGQPVPPEQVAQRGWERPAVQRGAARPVPRPLSPRPAPPWGQPSSRRSSWLACPQQPAPAASPHAGAWPPVLRPWTTQTSRTRPYRRAWQGLPCWLPRAPWRAHGPEPSTLLSCLGPGIPTRTVSADAACSCSRAHGVFILESLPIRSVVDVGLGLGH